MENQPHAVKLQIAWRGPKGEVVSGRGADGFDDRQVQHAAAVVEPFALLSRCLIRPGQEQKQEQANRSDETMSWLKFMQE
ncbi:MAG TPA: hypothetical protein DIT13_15245 [Verrucomicrobiales bacterium]|nr:hypothetical protein [Verrucomicrobiales bacterium]